MVCILLSCTFWLKGQVYPSTDEVYTVDYPDRVFRMEAWFRRVFREADGRLKDASEKERQEAFALFREAARKHKDRKADVYARVVALGQELRDRVLPPEWAEKRSAELIMEAQQLDFPVAAAQAEQHLAFYFGKRKDPGNEIFHLLQAYAHYRDLSPAVYPYRKYALYTLALHFYRVEEYGEALRFGVLADESRDTSRLNGIYVQTLLGLVHLRLGKAASALAAFNAAEKLADKVSIAVWSGICKGNKALAHFALGRREEAMAGLASAMRYCLQYGDTLNAIQFALARGKALLEDEDGVSDSLFVHWLPPLMRKCSSTPERLDWFHLMAAWQRRQGKTVLALNTMDSVLHYTLRLNAERGHKESARARLAFAQQQARVKTEQSRNEAHLQRLKWMSALACILAAGGIALWMMNRRKQRAEKRSYTAEMERNHAAAALHAADQRLREFMRTVAEKNKEIAVLRSDGNSNPDRDANIGLLRKSAILTEDDWLRFSELFDQVYPGYLGSLRQQMPGLTRAEQRYLALQRLQLSTREMAMMLGVGEEAIRSVRSRLRKKIPDTNW